MRPPPPQQAARTRCRQHFRVRRGVGDSRPCVAIVVPFREQREQDRGAQLRKFEDHMAGFLRGARFLVIVVTQSDDDRKFNRGQLLNVGAFRSAWVLTPRARYREAHTRTSSQDSSRHSRSQEQLSRPSSSTTLTCFHRPGSFATIANRPRRRGRCTWQVCAVRRLWSRPSKTSLLASLPAEPSHVQDPQRGPSTPCPAMRRSSLAASRRSTHR